MLHVGFPWRRKVTDPSKHGRPSCVRTHLLLAVRGDIGV